MDVEQLVTNNMGLVWAQLHKFKLAYDDDAVSFAMEGLLKAASTYNNTASFSTYATVCIYNAICLYLRPYRNKKQLTVVSYDKAIDAEDPEGATMLSVIEGAESVEDTIIRREKHHYIFSTIEKQIGALPESAKKKVIQAWYESDCEATQQELSEAAGVSQSYVSRIIREFRQEIKIKVAKYLCL